MEPSTVTAMPGGELPPDEEVPLAGGIANKGEVVRIGATVRRPVRPTSLAVRCLLDHLEAVGFKEAPRFLGLDEKGREVFGYIPGEVGIPPFNGWVTSDAAVAEVARLLRRYHEAVASFDWRQTQGWSEELADPTGDAIICHNDVCVENVVFREGRAVGLLDFDFAAPGAEVWDAAMTGRMWAPMAHPGCRTAWPSGLDAAHRLGVFARAYGIKEEGAVAFVDTVLSTHKAGRTFVRRHVDAGEPSFVEMWMAYDGPQRELLDDKWLGQNRAIFIAAVTAGVDGTSGCSGL